MKKEIKIPSLGESIAEVTVGQIFAPSGSLVKADEEILEMETDKVNQLLYAPQSGKLELSVKTGDVVRIGQAIGSIEPGEGKKEEAIPKPKEKELPPKEEEKKPEEPAPANVPKERPVKSGEKIRIGKEDFIAELAQEPDHPISQSLQREPGKETRRPMSKIRKVIAQRLVEAQQTMAMLTTFNEVDMSQVIELREKYKEPFAKKYNCKLGFMSFFVKAVVGALHACPDLNSYIEGEEIVHRGSYDIGVAVGTDKGVIVPVIRNCDQLSYAEIEQAIEAYAKKAREGKLVISDLQGGGFTITNGGIYGSLLSTPIVHPPQCGILGMHKIEKRPIVVNDQVVIRPMMYLALSYDHRLIDGKEAVTFLVQIKNMLEDSSRILLDV